MMIMMFNCILYLILLVNNVTFGQIVLNVTTTLQGKTKCSDPILSLLMSDSSKKYYGCCATAPTNAVQSNTNCCLLAGSYCDSIYKNSPNPCRGAPCCGTDTVQGGSSNTATVRLSGGTIYDINLRQFDYWPMRKSVQDRRPRLMLDKQGNGDCSDKNFKFFQTGTFQNVQLQGCCVRQPTTPMESATSCCLLSGSGCDGTVPCCSQRPCVLGKCPGDSGTQQDIDLSGYCTYFDNDFSEPINSSLALYTSPQQRRRSCTDTNFPSSFVFGTNQNILACCKKTAKTTDAKSLQDNCCLLGDSICDGSIDCCSGMPCCAGKCLFAAGDFYKPKVLNYPQPVC